MKYTQINHQGNRSNREDWNQRGLEACISPAPCYCMISYNEFRSPSLDSHKAEGGRVQSEQGRLNMGNLHSYAMLNISVPLVAPVKAKAQHSEEAAAPE